MGGRKGSYHYAGCACLACGGCGNVPRSRIGIDVFVVLIKMLKRMAHRTLCYQTCYHRQHKTLGEFEENQLLRTHKGRERALYQKYIEKAAMIKGGVVVQEGVRWSHKEILLYKWLG